MQERRTGIKLTSIYTWPSPNNVSGSGRGCRKQGAPASLDALRQEECGAQPRRSQAPFCRVGVVGWILSSVRCQGSGVFAAGTEQWRD